MSVSIRKAVSPDDFQRVFRLRYQVYVEEMGRVQRHANHASRTIEEPMDSVAHVFLAEDERGEVVGTVRTNFGGESDLGVYRSLYGLGGFSPEALARVSVTTKLIVAPRYRGRSLGIRLACALHSFGLKNGIRADFIDCNTHLEPVFEGLGYRRQGGPVVHPEFGPVTPLALLLADKDHLRAVGSPFLRNFADEQALLAGARGFRRGISLAEVLNERAA
jgi:GNAT superfamily N-acetyltransferase